MKFRKELKNFYQNLHFWNQRHEKNPNRDDIVGIFFDINA